MDPQILNEARSRVASVLGSKVAEKASDTFCAAFGLPHPAAFALETLGAPQRPPMVVIELYRQLDVSKEINKAVDKIRKTKTWEQFRKELKKIEIPQVTNGVTTEVMETGRSEPEILPIQAARLLRYLKVTSLRDNFLKGSAAITDQIQRSSQKFQQPNLEGFAGFRGPNSITQICWLNNTIRSKAHVGSLAEVAADDLVERIDVSRQLLPEVNVTAKTVGSTKFRTKFSQTGKGIIVAVIDSEVALNHPALKGRVAHKENFTEELWGNPGTHATAVAGIIGSNHSKFTGMAPEATIYNYKVIATNRALSGDDFDGALAIQQAVEDGAHIANCSWGNGPAGDGTSREAVACNEAWALGLTVVKSAGNLGPGAQTLTTPADADGVITVGAMDRKGTAVQDYSSRGPAGSKSRPHLLAPGGINGGAGIFSCLIGGGFGDCGAGTSFAAPHVSGLAALLLQQDPNLTPDVLREKLLAACTLISGLDVNTQGRGLLSLGSI